MENSESSSNDAATSHEEAEDDIANNNDPNNNACTVEENGSVENRDFLNDIVSEDTIEDEISNIQTLLPQSNREDIRIRLNAHWSNPSRQQVCFFSIISN